MKTIQELEKLTDDELRVMLAELVGWTNIGTTGNHGVPYGRHPEPSKRSARALDDLPNYPADLNATHEVERIFYLAVIAGTKKDKTSECESVLSEICHRADVERTFMASLT